MGLTGLARLLKKWLMIPWFLWRILENLTKKPQNLPGTGKIGFCVIFVAPLRGDRLWFCRAPQVQVSQRYCDTLEELSPWRRGRFTGRRPQSWASFSKTSICFLTWLCWKISVMPLGKFRNGPKGMFLRRPNTFWKIWVFIPTFHLSGGEKQRGSIARALALDPEILLLYEPTSALDPEQVRDVLELLQSLTRTNITLIVATHEIAFARNLATAVWFLDKGRLIEQGPSATFFQSPPPIPSSATIFRQPLVGPMLIFWFEIGAIWHFHWAITDRRP